MSDNADTAIAALADARRAPLVKVADGYFEFYLDGEMVYDFKPDDAAHAIRWLEHMVQKTWVTKEHVRQYATLAANLYGARYT